MKGAGQPFGNSRARMSSQSAASAVLGLEGVLGDPQHLARPLLLGREGERERLGEARLLGTGVVDVDGGRVAPDGQPQVLAVLLHATHELGGVGVGRPRARLRSPPGR